jgi:hypothetical protein
MICSSGQPTGTVTSNLAAMTIFLEDQIDQLAYSGRGTPGKEKDLMSYIFLGAPTIILSDCSFKNPHNTLLTGRSCEENITT